MWNRHILSTAAVATLLAVAGCGGEDSPTGTGGGGGTVTKVYGTWNTTNVNSNGVPSGRYYFEVDNGVVTGHSYWRYDGLLEHVGDLEGTVDANGNIELTTVMDDNGWDGVETASGRIIGVSFTGTYVWRTDGGTVIEQGTFAMKREKDPVALTPGEGPLGEAGYWRGAILYLSGGDCHVTGYLCTVIFDDGAPVIEEGHQDAVNLSGRLSARAFAGGPAPKEASAYLGPLGALVAGRRYASGEVVFNLNGDLKGTFYGGVVDTPTAYYFNGEFNVGTPCHDDIGTTTVGTFAFTAVKTPAP
jgi:hypothetical protein